MFKARDLDPAKLETITEEISLEQAPARAADLMAGQVCGRLVVKIGRPHRYRRPK